MCDSQLQTASRIYQTSKRRWVCLLSFTLVELLVVMFIITLLAAMLLPVMQSAMESARGTYCASNEKQIMTAQFLYSDDHRGYWWGRLGMAGPWIWHYSLATYTGQDGDVYRPPLWDCPSVQDHANNITYSYPIVRTDYWLQYYTVARATDTGNCLGWRKPYVAIFKSYKLPSRTLFFTTKGNPGTIDVRKPGDGGSQAGYVHQKRANFMCMDGHVWPLRSEAKENWEMKDFKRLYWYGNW